MGGVTKDFKRGCLRFILTQDCKLFITVLNTHKQTIFLEHVNTTQQGKKRALEILQKAENRKILCLNDLARETNQDMKWVATQRRFY